MPQIDLNTLKEPIRRDVKALIKRGYTRANSLLPIFEITSVDFKGKKILEIGCGNGETSIALHKKFGAKAIGIDLGGLWLEGYFKNFNNKNKILHIVDASSDEMLSLGKFDYIISFDVFEHIEKPRKAIQNIYNLLEDGGLCFARFNLYYGPSASHLMSSLNIPWAHLLYSDDAIRTMMKEKTGKDVGLAWVNKLSHLHYLDYFEKENLVVKKKWFRTFNMDPNFYKLHFDKLKSYPEEDLCLDFMHVLLEKKRHL